jgi:hypothetical protein
VQPLGLGDSCGGQTDLLLITGVAQAFGEHFRSPPDLPCLEPRRYIFILIRSLSLKGTVSRDFFLQVFFHESSSPKPLYGNGPIWTLEKKTCSRKSHDTVPLSFTL